MFIINQDVDPMFGRDWIREVNLDWAELKTHRRRQLYLIHFNITSNQTNQYYYNAFAN